MNEKSHLKEGSVSEHQRIFLVSITLWAGAAMLAAPSAEAWPVARPAPSDKAPPEDPPEQPLPTAQEESTAFAPRSTGNGLVSAFLGLGYAYSDSGFGVGARYQKVVAPIGVIKQGPVHDEVALEGGFDYFHYSFGYRLGSFSQSWTYNEVAFTFGAAWNFWMLEDKLALYPKLDLSYRIGSVSGDIGSMSGYGGLWFQATGGVMYRTGNVTLRAELGSGSLRLGAGLAFF